MPEKQGGLAVIISRIDFISKKVGGKNLCTPDPRIDIITFLKVRIVQDIRGVNNAPVFIGLQFIGKQNKIIVVPQIFLLIL